MTNLEEKKQAKRLRKQAEAIVRRKTEAGTEQVFVDYQSVLHELQVHQEELTLQNEELRAAQQALETALDQYADLYHNAPLGYCTVNKKGQILEANHTLARLLNIDHAQLLKRRFSDFILPEEQDQYYLYLQEMLEQAANKIIELQMVKKDGEQLAARLESCLDRHNPDRIRVTVSDNTERKQAQSAIEDYSRELESVNQALYDFTFIASHDLREPLRKVKAFGDLLSSQYGEQLSQNGREYVSRMVSAVDRMDAMLKGLLAYSQIASKAAPFTEVNLTKLVEGVVSDLEVHIMHSHGNMIIHDLPTIRADELQMRALFQNLISNALKYHRPETAPIVSIYSQTNHPSRVDILVEDNGIGIDMQYTKFIFEPFSRLSGKPEYEGTGMGLAICKKIIDRHSGSITVSSKPGQGSTFIITLPRLPDPTA